MNERPRLTDEANQTLKRARALANMQGHDRASSLELLNAFVEGGRARELLALFGPHTDRLPKAISFASDNMDWPRDSAFEETAVELARDEAARLGHSDTGSEHLMLGVLRTRQTLGTAILESLGTTLDSAREAVRYMHGDVADWESPGDPSVSVSRAAMKFAGSVPPEEMARLAKRAEVAHLGPGALERVIAIGQAVTNSDVVVEMIALEVRELVAIVHWRTERAIPRLTGSPDITVSDDIGTSYEAFASSWSGSEHESHGETNIVPPPPAEASRLSIEIRSFGGDMRAWPLAPTRGIKVIDGPWRFEVALKGSV